MYVLSISVVQYIIFCAFVIVIYLCKNIPVTAAVLEWTKLTLIGDNLIYDASLVL
jgi:hypothetical protein